MMIRLFKSLSKLLCAILITFYCLPGFSADEKECKTIIAMLSENMAHILASRELRLWQDDITSFLTAAPDMAGADTPELKVEGFEEISVAAEVGESSASLVTVRFMIEWKPVYPFNPTKIQLNAGQITFRLSRNAAPRFYTEQLKIKRISANPSNGFLVIKRILLVKNTDRHLGSGSFQTLDDPGLMSNLRSKLERLGLATKITESEQAGQFLVEIEGSQLLVAKIEDNFPKHYEIVGEKDKKPRTGCRILIEESALESVKSELVKAGFLIESTVNQSGDFHLITGFYDGDLEVLKTTPGIMDAWHMDPSKITEDKP
jgi:hypothetical protein